jgi:hypothetical protein
MVEIHFAERKMVTASRIVLAGLILTLTALLCIFVSPVAVLATLAGAAFVWMPVRHPVSTLGLVLAFVSIDFMAIAFGKFFGLPQMTLVSILDKEVALLLLAIILWQRNGFKPVAPDWFLLACFFLALLRTVLGGTLGGFALDLDFVIPYAVGRVTVLSEIQEATWAKSAIWIAGVLSVLGMIEVFVLGEGPRTILYTALDSGIERGQLTDPFHGTGLIRLREAATMVGPNGFAALCMIALIIWWVYSRNPLTGTLIGLGLICSVTRAAWLGTVIAMAVLAVMMGQVKRMLFYAGLAVGVFLISVPVLGLSDYLYYNKTAQDPSAEYHGNEILSGLRYDAEHPFGSGNEKISPTASQQNDNGLYFETTYPAFAAAYGIPAILCFLGFLYTTFCVIWRKRSRLAHAAVGILIGMCVVMTFTNSLIDRRLIVWAWFPIGLAVRACLGSTGSNADWRQNASRAETA